VRHQPQLRRAGEVRGLNLLFPFNTTSKVCVTMLSSRPVLKKDDFKWGAEVEEAFRRLYHALIAAPVLQLLAFDRPFVVEFDASNSGIGAVLHQGNGPVAFFSHQIAIRYTKLAAYVRIHWPRPGRATPEALPTGVRVHGPHEPLQPQVFARPTTLNESSTPVGEQASWF
jgi:hypothetical protein